MTSRIAFYHINKSAGTTLLEYFMSKVGVERHLRVEENVEYSTGRPMLPTIDRLMRAEFIHDPAGMANWNKVLGNTINVLWLRRPVDRIVSQHAMISRWTDEECGPLGSDNRALRDLAHEGLEAFMISDNMLAHRLRFNGITGFLQLGDRTAASLWENGRFAEHEPSRRKGLEIALRNLADMHFIGFVETFDQSFEAMTQAIGWPTNDKPHAMNVFRTGAANLTEAEMAALGPAAELDEEIYAAALKLVEERQAGGAAAMRMATPNRMQEERIGPRRSLIAHAGGNEFIEGWYSCEKNGEKLSRWSGPSPQSSIALHVEKGRDLFIRVRISQARSMTQLNNLTCKVDGFDVKLTSRIVGPHDLIFEGAIRASKLNLSDKLLWIVLDCGETQRAAHSLDTRHLGVELCEVEVGPNENYASSSLSLLPFRQ